MLFRSLEVIFPCLPETLQSNINRHIREKHFHSDYTYGLSPIAMQDEEFLKYVATKGRFRNFTRRWLESRKWRRSFILGYSPAENYKYLTACSGIEKRDPTMDIRLVEFLQKIPVEQFSKNGEKSRLLKLTLENYWPCDHIQNRIKGLQSADTMRRLVNEKDEIGRTIRYFDKNSKYREIIDHNRLIEDYEKETIFNTSKAARFIRRLAIINFIKTQ